MSSSQTSNVSWILFWRRSERVGVRRVVTHQNKIRKWTIETTNSTNVNFTLNKYSDDIYSEKIKRPNIFTNHRESRTGTGTWTGTEIGTMKRSWDWDQDQDQDRDQDRVQDGDGDEVETLHLWQNRKCFLSWSLATVCTMKNFFLNMQSHRFRVLVLLCTGSSQMLT